jgi:hypothetical protein
MAMGWSAVLMVPVEWGCSWHYTGRLRATRREIRKRRHIKGRNGRRGEVGEAPGCHGKQVMGRW